MKRFICLLALLLLPALADTDAQTSAAMKKLYATALSVEKRASGLNRPPGKATTRELEAMDGQLEALKKELFNAKKALPPSPPDREELAVQHSKLRDLVDYEFDWLSRKQNWIATGARGNPEVVERSVNEAYARYTSLRDELKSGLR